MCWRGTKRRRQIECVETQFVSYMVGRTRVSNLRAYDVPQYVLPYVKARLTAVRERRYGRRRAVGVRASVCGDAGTLIHRYHLGRAVDGTRGQLVYLLRAFYTVSEATGRWRQG